MGKENLWNWVAASDAVDLERANVEVVDTDLKFNCARRRTSYIVEEWDTERGSTNCGLGICCAVSQYLVTVNTAGRSW